MENSRLLARDTKDEVAAKVLKELMHNSVVESYSLSKYLIHRIFLKPYYITDLKDGLYHWSPHHIEEAIKNLVAAGKIKISPDRDSVCAC